MWRRGVRGRLMGVGTSQPSSMSSRTVWCSNHHHWVSHVSCLRLSHFQTVALGFCCLPPVHGPQRGAWGFGDHRRRARSDTVAPMGVWRAGNRENRARSPMCLSGWARGCALGVAAFAGLASIQLSPGLSGQLAGRVALSAAGFHWAGRHSFGVRRMSLIASSPTRRSST